MNRTLLGVLTPSSNTILEPATSALVARVPGASAHFSRLNVLKIALDDDSDNQFAREPMLAAARLLADARVGVIAWSGTSASWLGPDWDDALCAALTAETGIPACTAVGAINELVALRGARRLGLVSPYTTDVQERIAVNYAAQGIEVVAEAHSGLSTNYEFATVSDERVGQMCREVAARGVDAIVIMCTNMRGWNLMAGLEAELGVPVIDSTAAVVWKALSISGADMAPLADAGWMFGQSPTA